MRPSSRLVLAALLAAAFSAPALVAEEDPKIEAKFLAMDNKFDKADALIEHAGPALQDDVELRLYIGELAMKHARTLTGEDRRKVLFSARQHFARAVEVKPAEAKAATGLLAAASGLAELDVAARLPDDARGQAKFALDLAAKAEAAGVATPEFKVALGRMYGLRASLVKTMNEKQALVDDSTKAATLLAEASSADKETEGRLLSEASAIRLSAANLIHERAPGDDVKDDDEALAAAIDLATKACNLQGASEADFATHLAALRLAHSWGMKLAVQPFMTPLGPPVPNLKLELPRSGGWTKSKSEDWVLFLERNLHDPRNDGTVQIMLKEWGVKETSLGLTWDRLSEIAQRRTEKYKEDQATLGSVVAPVQLGGGKNSLDLWHYQVSGQGKTGRVQRIAEWIWFGDRKKEYVWQLKIIDWRPSPDIEDPDIVAFVASAIGPGLWPPGAAAPKGKDAPKDPKKPKKGK